MEGKGSWRLAFEMVELDRMARPKDDGAKSGRQLPQMMVLAHRHFGQRGTRFSRLIDPAATMHARAASMRMACSMQLHACMVPRRRARIRRQLYMTQLYRTISSWRRREALLLSSAYPSRVFNV